MVIQWVLIFASFIHTTHCKCVVQSCGHQEFQGRSLDCEVADGGFSQPNTIEPSQPMGTLNFSRSCTKLHEIIGSIVGSFVSDKACC